MTDSDDAESAGATLESPVAPEDGDPDTDPFRAADPGPGRTGPFAGPTTGSIVIPEPEPTGDAFDAFDTNTWRFRQPAPPWYRTRDARLLLIAVAVAVVALVVSVVVLATRRDSGSDQPTPTPSDSSTTTTTFATTPTTTDTTTQPPVTTPPPPPPPPPPAAAPPPVGHVPTVPAAPTARGPELNVTRAPISVTPVMPRRH